MADADVYALLKKATEDDVFRLSLARNFDGVISAHNLNLSEIEVDALKEVDWTAALPEATAGKWIHIYSREV